MPDIRDLPEGPVDPEQGQLMLLDHARQGPIQAVPIQAALGRIAGADCPAKWPLPQWRLSKMDGYAVGPVGSTPGQYLLCGESAAGAPAQVSLQPGQCMRISTGAVVSDESFAVVPQEDTECIDNLVKLSPQAQAQLAQGRYIRDIGSDLPAQGLVCQAGQVLDAGRLSLLASTGYAQVEVVSAPKVGILSTGSELVAMGQTPKRGQIIATNAMVLRWQCEQVGAQVVEELHVPDSRQDTQNAIATLAKSCDLVLTCGGISVGPHDHVLPSLIALGWQGLFRKVKLAPGRPTTAGVLNNKIVLALPGNPASSYVTFELFVRPVLRKMLGFRELYRPQRWVRCNNLPMGDAKRDRYLRVVVQGQSARALSTQQSGDLSSLCGHNALLAIPAQTNQGPYRALLLGEHDFEPATPDA